MARKLLLEHINVPGINTFDVYRSKGGYAAVVVQVSLPG
jgi:NADH-quinone oxidoreductase subunit F